MLINQESMVPTNIQKPKAIPLSRAQQKAKADAEALAKAQAIEAAKPQAVDPTLSKQTIVRNFNNSPAPGVEVFQPDNNPYVHQEGMGVMDIIARGKANEEKIQGQEQRTQRSAKMMAFADFAKALGGLAGGGYANTTQYAPSPYLTKAFGEIDKLRSDRERSNLYYDELASSTRRAEYNAGLKAHNATQVQNNKFSNDAVNNRNKARMEMWKSNTTSVREEHEDPTYKNKMLQNDTTRANAAMIRANKDDSGANNKADLIQYGEDDGQISTMSKSNAIRLFEDIQADYDNIVRKADKGGKLTPQEEEIYNDRTLMDLANNKDAAVKSDNTIQGLVYRYIRKDTTGTKYDRYFNSGPRVQGKQPQQKPNMVMKKQYPDLGTGNTPLPNFFK